MLLWEQEIGWNGVKDVVKPPFVKATVTESLQDTRFTSVIMAGDAG